jgi:RNA polymerase primary sigma factor
MQALAEQSRLVRLPLNKVGSLSKIRKALIQLEQEFDREPSIEELANYLDISQREVEQTLKLSSRHTSLDAPLIEGESSSLSDVLQNDNADFADSFLEYADSLKRETERSLSTLTFRQREILKLYYGIGIDHPMSLEDIGDELGILNELFTDFGDVIFLRFEIN